MKRKEVLQEGGERKYVLVIVHRYGDREWVIRVGIEGDLDKQELLYDALPTGVQYRCINYTMTLPGSLVDELGFRGGLGSEQYDVLFQHPEIVEEYLKVKNVSAD